MNNERIPDLFLERYLLNELSEKLRLEIAKRLEYDHSARQRLNELRESNSSFLAKYPPRQTALAISRLAEYQQSLEKKSGLAKKFIKQRFLVPSLAAGTALVMLVLFLPGINTDTTNTPYTGGEITRIKGDTGKLFIYRKGNSSEEILNNGSRAKEKDLLQLAYISTEHPFGMIFSIDGRGTVTLHFPEKKTGSTELIRHKKTFLANSYELDDAPEFERFFFLTGNKPIPVARVLEKAEDLAHRGIPAVKGEVLTLDAAMNQATILIDKQK